MSAALSKDLRKKHGARSMPVRKDDEVSIVKGSYKGHKGKVTQVYRLRWCIYVEKLSKSKANGQPVQVPIKPS
jgi:large subunit ribosomal protein L26e